MESSKDGDVNETVSVETLMCYPSTNGMLHGLSQASVLINSIITINVVASLQLCRVSDQSSGPVCLDDHSSNRKSISSIMLPYPGKTFAAE